MNIPSSLMSKAEEILEHLLPNKSTESYNEVFVKLLAWSSEENVMPKDASVDILLIYIYQLISSKHCVMW